MQIIYLSCHAERSEAPLLIYRELYMAVRHSLKVLHFVQNDRVI